MEVFVPGPNALSDGHRPYYCIGETTDSNAKYLDVASLQPASRKTLENAGYGMKIDTSFDEQPILIATGAGGYLIFGNGLRLVNAQLAAIRSSIMGVYPLHGLISYKTPANQDVIYKLQKLREENQPITKY